MRLAITAWSLFVLGASLGFADGFTFTIGSPVAAQDFRAKTATFVFRTEACAEPAKPQISGTAEGLVGSTRRSVPLNLMATSKPGVYAVYRTWPAEGDWVVNLKGSCADVSAGAIVPVGPNGFIRESARFFPRPATSSEIESSLKALAQGGRR
jgi:hypothetical protein